MIFDVKAGKAEARKAEPKLRGITDEALVGEFLLRYEGHGSRLLDQQKAGDFLWEFANGVAPHSFWKK